MTRFLKYVTNADGELVSELDVELPAGDTTYRHDTRATRRWQTRPINDPTDEGDAA